MERLGPEFILNKVRIRRDVDGCLFVKLRDGSEVRSRSVVLATGVQFREMANVPGMSELKGKGVYYGSSLPEAPLTKPGEKIVIVGGANSAGQAAVKFSELVGPKGEVRSIWHQQTGNITIKNLETGAHRSNTPVAKASKRPIDFFYWLYANPVNLLLNPDSSRRE